MDIRRVPLGAILKRRCIEFMLLLVVVLILLCKLTNYGLLVRVIHLINASHSLQHEQILT